MKKQIFKLGSFVLEEENFTGLHWPQINSIISYLKRKRCFHYSISLSYFNHWRCMLCSTYLTKAPPVPHTRWWDFQQTVWCWKHKIFIRLNLESSLFDLIFLMLFTKIPHMRIPQNILHAFYVPGSSLNYKSKAWHISSWLFTNLDDFVPFF